MSSAIGSALGSAMTPQMLQTLSTIYREPPRLLPQAYGSFGTMDPYASLRPMMATQMNMPGAYAYGMW
jgi:hypothetical protein